MGPLRILIVDDHELVRRGLRSILVTRPEWEICGEAADGSNAIEKARELKSGHSASRHNDAPCERARCRANHPPGCSARESNHTQPV